jgi:uncharacterized protein (DUF2252 family)
MNLARYLAGVVARAHGRQMKASQRRAWRSDLAKNHKASLEAPSWLWGSVVELLGLHEAAYLDHCRRFALLEAAWRWRPGPHAKRLKRARLELTSFD